MSTATAHPFPVVDLLGYVSPSSEDTVSKIIRDTSRHFALPATRQKRQEAINAALSAYLRSQREGITDDNTPISKATCNETIKFLRSLPSTIPIPEAVKEPDGDLALEWYVDNYRSFVVSFSGKGIIAYSGLFGRGRKAYGTELISEGIPQAIIENVRRLLT
jgi:hypothetical protein